jgi:ATP-binding protein involved in chromosome partitioning
MFFASKTLKEADITRALGNLPHPGSGRALSELQMISGVVIKSEGGKSQVRFVLNLGPEDKPHMDALRQLTEEKIKSLKSVNEAQAIFTASGQMAEPPHAARPGPKPKGGIRHFGKVIAVLSGKGGVGKSTVAANLACALAKKGLRVGLLDADIYGPSVPRLFGITEKPKTEGGKMVPIEKYGVKLISIGFILEESAPVVWRGLMVMKAIKQLLEDVVWGDLDTLVIDMPPGTGDVQLTLSQSLDIAGGVIVSTPQDLALIDARKAIAMLQKMNVPVLGVIENMSQFICPHCGGASEIFGHGGAAKEAEKINAPFLGEIPLTIKLRETSDAGTPIAAIAPQDPAAQHFMACADSIWESVLSVKAVA